MAHTELHKLQQAAERKRQAAGGGTAAPGPGDPGFAEPDFTGTAPGTTFGSGNNPQITVNPDGSVTVNGEVLSPEDADIASVNNPEIRQAIIENRNRISNTSRTSTTNINRTGQTNITGTETITGSERRYIDVPTPEEFLDDFRTGLVTHIKQVRADGGLSGLGVNASTWIMENMNILFDAYTAELGTRAARGEQIFEVVGATGTPQFEGQREGRVSNINRKGTTVEKGTTTTQQAGTTVTKGQTKDQVAPGSTGGTGQPLPQDQTIVNSQDTQNVNDTTRTSTTDVTNRNQQTQTNVKEDIFSRPNLTTVKKLSPLDFLGKNFGEGSLKILFEGRRGMRRANAAVRGGTSARSV